MSAQVWAVVNALTPLQWRVLAQAGMPRWLDLAALWQPVTQAETFAALALCQAGILERVGQYEYQLTHLGEVIAGHLLQQGVLRRD